MSVACRRKQSRPPKRSVSVFIYLLHDRRSPKEEAYICMLYTTVKTLQCRGNTACVTKNIIVVVVQYFPQLLILRQQILNRQKFRRKVTTKCHILCGIFFVRKRFKLWQNPSLLGYRTVMLVPACVPVCIVQWQQTCRG